jgi:GR25 family glycosyltransferase involved in LPS biosynthesis
MLEFASIAYNCNKYIESYDMYNKILALPLLSENESNQIILKQKCVSEHIKNTHITYNRDIINNILKTNNTNSLPRISFTITSCKRLDLFKNTMNSFLNCCEDLHLIDEWFCVDDNSSEDDRNEMKELFPFFKFYFKTYEEKGHPQSMNIIQQIVKTPYLFHMEDDWTFIQKRKYISECLDVISENISYKQCLINKNYSETIDDIGNIKGGIFKQTLSGLRYYIHEHVTTKKEESDWINKHGLSQSSNYWPHFSFRPSLLQTDIWKKLGNFDQQISHFEMEYSNKYIKHNYKSCFLESVYSIHTGRLTSERDNAELPNAYDLNNEFQFEGKESMYALPKSIQSKNIESVIKTFVINLKRREDRLHKFISKINSTHIQYNIFNAVDGSQLSPSYQLERIFENNDYNMRKGMVGCAMSHIQLYINLINSHDTNIYCILEDDVDFVHNFQYKLTHVYNQLISQPNWDICYLGHHLYSSYVSELSYNNIKIPTIEKWNQMESMARSIGGTGGYIISKKGAIKLLEHINTTGMTNGIDTVQQKAADVLDIFYCEPHLIYSECVTNNSNADTDIQHEYDSLSLKDDYDTQKAENMFPHRFKVDGKWDISNSIENELLPNVNVT